MPYFTPLFIHSGNGVIPYWYPTLALVNDVRVWDVSITPPATILPTPIAANQIQISLYRILLEAGIAFTQGVGLQVPSPSALAPIFRYIDLFTGTGPGMRLIGELQYVDPRFKQLIAEEIGLGIAWYILKEHLDAVHIADAGPLLNPPPGQPALLAFVAGNADNKRPDFYCETPNSEILLAESKGTVGPRSKMTGPSGPLAKGWHQVNNVTPTSAQVRPQCGRVVIGTNIQLDLPSIRSDSMTHIRDPVGPEQKELQDENDFAIRVSYAKVLKYVGEIGAAELLIARQQWPSHSVPGIQWNRLSLIPLGFAPIGGLVAIEQSVFEILRDNHAGSLRPTLDAALSQFTATLDFVQPSVGTVAYRNGVVVFANDEFYEPDLIFPFPWAPFPRPLKM